MTAPSAPALSEVAVEAFLPFYCAVSASFGRTDLEYPGLEYGILDHVERLSLRCVLSAFHEFRESIGLPIDPESNAALTAFSEALALDPEEIYARFPVLRERIELLVANLAVARDEFVDRFSVDLPRLRSLGWVDASATPTSVRRAGSDLHLAGHEVLFVEFSCGSTVVYKPRSLAPDDFARGVLATVEEHLRLDLRECVPSSIDRGDYGWQQYVPPVSPTTSTELSDYYYRFGALCGVLGAIGAIDLHEENVRCRGSYPCLVDTETLCRPDAGVADEPLQHLLINASKLSLASTMLMPLSVPNQYLGLMMAGIGQPEVQQSERKMARVVDELTDAVRLEWTPIVYAHGDNLPVVDGEPVAPWDHAAAIAAGLRDVAPALASPELLQVIERHAEAPVRRLVRSTLVYARFLDASTHPKYLADSAAFDGLLAKMSGLLGFVDPGIADAVTRLERDALFASEIPLFTAPGNRRSVDSRVPGDAYKSSPVEFAARGLALATRNDPDFSEWIFEDSLAEIATPRVPGPIQRTLPTPDAVSWALSVADALGRSAVCESADQPDAGCAWVLNLGPSEEHPTLTTAPCLGFHDAGGIVRLLLDAAAVSPQPHRVAVAQRARNGVQALLREPAAFLGVESWGVMSGPASTAFTDPQLGAEEIASILRIAAETEPLCSDMVSGPAGLAALVARNDILFAPTTQEQRAWMASAAYSSLDSTLEAPDAGLAHGRLGVLWAADAVAARMGDDHIRDRCREGVARYVADLDPADGVAWCAGLSGLLLVANDVLGVHAAMPVADALLDAIRRTREPGAPVDLSVCHGLAGAAQTLAYVGSTRDVPAFSAAAVELCATMLEHVGDGTARTGSDDRANLRGGLLGWAGIANTMLNVHHPTGDCPIALIIQPSR